MIPVKCRIPKGIGKLIIIPDSSVGSAHFEMYWPSGHILACPFFVSFHLFYFILVFISFIFLFEFIYLDIDSYLFMHYLFSLFSIFIFLLQQFHNNVNFI